MKTPTPNSLRFIPAALALVFTLLANHAGAGILYWDNNGTATPTSGTWDTSSSFWASSSTLVASPGKWNTSDAAAFCGGSSSGTVTITVGTANLAFAGFQDAPTPGTWTVTINQSGSGSLSINSGLQGFNNGGGPMTVNVPLVGSGGIAVQSGQLALYGTNTYSGGTQIGWTGLPYSSIIYINSSSSFGNSSGGIVVSNCPGGAIVAGVTTAFTVPNSFTFGATNLPAQILNVVGNTSGVTYSGNWNLGGLPVILENGNTAVNSNIISGAISGSANFFIADPGTLFLTGANTYTGPTCLTNISGLSGPPTVIIGGSGKLNGGSYAGNIYNDGTFIYNSSVNQTLSGVISRGGTLTQSGTGTLTLSGANTYTGTTTINGGLLTIGADNNLGAAETLTINSGTTANYGLRCTGTFSLSAGRGPTLGANGGAIQVSTGNTLTVPGVISGSGNFMCGTAATVGEGTLILSGANTYTGSTTVGCGTLQLNTGGSLPSATALTVASAAVGGIFNMNNISQTVASLASSTGVNSTTGTTVPTVSLGSGTLTVQGPGSGTFGSATTGGTISGSGGLIIDGTGTLTLSGTNTYTGATTVSGTTGYGNTPMLSISTASALGSTSGLTLNNGTLKNNDTAPTLGSGLTITLGAGGGYFDAGWAPSNPITINGPITGAGALYINLDGSPVVLANTGNNYTGDTVIGAEGPGWYASGSQAWLQLGAAGVIPNGSGYGNVVINGGTGYLGELDLNGYSQTINGLSGSGTVESASGSPTLTVGNNNATSAFSGVIENGAGTVALTKVGTGTLTLAGANTYTGATTISAGTLLLAGSVSSSSVTVPNYNFATPSESASPYYAYNPSGGSWSFVASGSGGGSGIAANSGPWYSVSSPSGTQAAFIQESGGSVSQSITFPSTGGYQVSWEAIGRSGSGGAGTGPQTLILEIDGNPIMSFTPGNTAWAAYTSPVVSLAAGAHTVAFQGTATIDNSTCITAVTISGLSGSGGSISSTPTISLAAGATFDVSAAGITLTGSSPQQTLAGSSTSGTATINAPSKTVTLSTSALLSFQAAGGGSSTVGKISVSGASANLTLNNNTVTVNVTGSALAAGSYRLLDCTGTLTGSANTTPTITGTALATGYTATVSTTAGASGHVDLIVKATPAFTGLTASPSITYGATSVTLSGAVSSTTGPTTVYAANGDTVTATIGGHAVNGTVSGSAGGFSIAYNDASLKTDAYGTYPITYAYAGNSAVYLNAAANNTSTSLTVNKAALGITANNDSKTYGQAKTYGAGSTAFTSTGLQNSETIGSVTITASGGTAATAAVGSYNLTPSAAMGGTFTAGNYSLTYNNGTLTVNPLAVQLSGTRAYDGTTNADAAILSVANPVDGDTVNVASGSAGLAGADAGSEAITSLGALALGNNAAGDYTLSGASGSVTITNASTTNSVAASPNPSLPGANVIFTATLGAVPPGAGTPTGSVRFKTNGIALCDAIALDGSGVATLITNSLPHGSNTVTAEFTGNANLLGNTNFLGATNSVVQIVNTPPTAPNSTAGVTENSNLVLFVAKLLRTASDPDPGDTLSVTAAGPTSTNGPANNVVLDTGAGTITYTPATGYVGADSFTYTVSDNYGGTVTPTVFVTVTSAGAPSLNIVIPPTYDSGSGTFSVTFAGIPGYIYTIQTATNLDGPWSFLQSATSGADGLFQIIDTEEPPPPARYYRTVYP